MKDQYTNNNPSEEPEDSEQEHHCSDSNSQGITPTRKMNEYPPDARGLINSISVRASSIYPPDELAEYERLCPGFAKEYLTSHNKIFKDEVSHRKEMDREKISLHKESLKLENKNLDIYREVTKANLGRSTLGLWGGLALLFVALGLGGYAIHKEQKWVAGTIFGTTIGALAINYAGAIFSSKQSRNLDSSDEDKKSIEDSENSAE